MKRSLKGMKTGENAQKSPHLDYERAASMAQNVDAGILNNVQDALNQYGGKSRSELMRELKNFKSAGMIDEHSLGNVAEILMPMLTAEQQRRLFDVMGELKK